MRGPAVRPIIIAAGGTGGHVFPAEALAAALIDRGHRIVLMTDERSGALQSPVFAMREQHVLKGAGIAGLGILNAGRALLSLTAGVAQARRLLKSLDAAVIVAFGGYPSVPPVLAASLLRRRPLVILHEQNAVLGRANRVLAARANLLALGFADTARVPRGAATLVIGNPVRPAIRAAAAQARLENGDRIELLVLGGSLGARIFSDVVPDAVARLPAAIRARLHVVQQCRAEDLGRVREAYAAVGVNAELASFFGDVADRLQAAHLVVSRAGASSCAEIAVLGRACVLVPLPNAIDDHQSANARALSGAVVIKQPDATPANLSAAMATLLNDPAALADAERRIAACARPRAAADLADAVERLMAQAEVRP